jgi:UrcA family protein
MKRFLAILAFPVSLAASPVQAASFDDQVTRVIPYDDRGLYSDDGLANLERRIGIAANQVCLDPTGPSPAVTVNLVCRAEVLRSAHAQLAEAIARPKP